MRHLIDTYIEADEPRKISPFDDMGLLDLIVKTGIANAIASQLGGLKGNKNAVAETIENNVRKKIIKEHLSDPAFYDKMSTLLDEIIAARKAKAIEYEKYLQQIAELVKQVEAGHAPDMPVQLNTPGRRALYNLFMQGSACCGASGVADSGASAGGTIAERALNLALRIDAAIKHVRPDAWRGIKPKENDIKAALYGILQDVAEVERIFLIVRQQREY